MLCIIHQSRLSPLRCLHNRGFDRPNHLRYNSRRILRVCWAIENKDIYISFLIRMHYTDGIRFLIKTLINVNRVEQLN